MSAARRRALVLRSALAAALALALAACSSTTPAAEIEAQRKLDEEFLATHAEDLFHADPHGFAIVQGGESVGTAPTTYDAALLAASRTTDKTHHRFVFRRDDAGERLHRLAFLPTGGIVAGRGFLAALGYRVVSVGTGGPGRPLVLERHGARLTIDLAAQPRLRVEVGPIAGTPDLPLDVPLDPDFDGPLLLRADLADALDLELAEIPGKAELQVALGRPFAARRSWVMATCSTLDAAEKFVEVLVERPGPAAGKRP